MTESLVGGASAAPLSMRATAAVASAIVSAARQLLTELEQGRRIDAAVLRNVMQAAFAGSDATGLWNWKTAYDACEAATVLFLRRHGAAMRAKAASPAVMLSMLMRIASLLSDAPVRGKPIAPAVLDADRTSVCRERCGRNDASRCRAGAVSRHRPSCHPRRTGRHLAHPQ
jgi:hypothetical protein